LCSPLQTKFIFKILLLKLQQGVLFDLLESVEEAIHVTKPYSDPAPTIQLIWWTLNSYLQIYLEQKWSFDKIGSVAKQVLAA